MKDLQDKRKRQKFLQDRVNRNLLAKKLKQIMSEAETKGLASEAKLIGKLINYLNSDSPVVSKDIRRILHYRKLKIK